MQEAHRRKGCAFLFTDQAAAKLIGPSPVIRAKTVTPSGCRGLAVVNHTDSMHDQGSLITVAVPTLLGGQLLASCLDALNSQSFRDFEVIIIDNGRAGQIPTPASHVFPCRILSPGSNVGFGAAVNLAIRASSTPYVAILNDDTEPDANWLSSLVSELDADPRVGMCVGIAHSVARKFGARFRRYDDLFRRKQ